MAIAFWDGFDTYNAAADVTAAGYLNAPNALSASGRFSGSRAMSRVAASSTVKYVFASTTDTVTAGFAYQCTSLGTSATGTLLFSFESAAEAIIVRVGVTNLGAIVVGRGDFTTNLIAASANGVLTTGAYQFIEIELKRSASAGELRVWVDGTAVLSGLGSALNTGATTLGIFGFGTGPNPATSLYDDFYFGTAATDHLGDTRVETLFPSADTAQKDWGRSAGSDNYALVDEQPENGDTDYVTDSTVGHKDFYDCANLSSTPASIFGIGTEIVARKDDATARTVRANMKSGSTTSNGATRTLSTSYQIWKDFYLTNPDAGGSAWTATTANAAQVGPEVVS